MGKQSYPAVVFRLLRSVSLTCFLYGLLVWIYVVIINFYRSDWLPLPFTHINQFPLNLRTDTTGVIAFIVSAIGYFTFQLLHKT